MEMIVVWNGTNLLFSEIDNQKAPNDKLVLYEFWGFVLGMIWGRKINLIKQ
jgi:hypothetical protein